MAAIVDDAEGRDLADEVEEEADLFGAGPDLAIVDDVDAFAELANGGVGEAEDAADAGAEGVDYDLAGVALAEEDDGDLRVGEMEAASGGEAGVVVMSGVEEEDVDAGGEGESEDGVDVHVAGGDSEIGAAAESAG